jgi:hypothetical protein
MSPSVFNSVFFISALVALNIKLVAEFSFHWYNTKLVVHCALVCLLKRYDILTLIHKRNPN